MSTDRIVELEREVRTQLHQVTREVAVERGITRDLIEALHVRLDRFQDEVLTELRAIRSAQGNGHV